MTYLSEPHLTISYNAAEMTDVTSPPDLAATLAQELASACSTIFDTEITFDCPNQWLLSTVLDLRVKTDMPWYELIEGIEEVVNHCPLVHDVWINNHVWLHMGLDIWQSTRLDRFGGSRVLSMANNDALDSPKRVQTIRLTSATERHITRPRSTRKESSKIGLLEFTSISSLKAYQTMAHFLKASLRLSSSDISRVIRILMDNGLE